MIYVNGLPLVVFELKNPWDEYVDVAGAYNQIGHYTVDIPQLFIHNALCVVSDGTTTLHGMYAPASSGSRPGNPSMASRWSPTPPAA